MEEVAGRGAPPSLLAHTHSRQLARRHHPPHPPSSRPRPPPPPPPAHPSTVPPAPRSLLPQRRENILGSPYPLGHCQEPSPARCPARPLRNHLLHRRPRSFARCSRAAPAKSRSSRQQMLLTPCPLGHSPRFCTARAALSPQGSLGTSERCCCSLLAHHSPHATPAPPCPAHADPSLLPLGPHTRAPLLPVLQMSAGQQIRGQWRVGTGGQISRLMLGLGVVASADCYVLLSLCGRKCQIAWVYLNTI